MASEFRITGKHVLFTLIGFFLVILTVNIIFINFAVKTFPGEKEEKSYLQGLNFNDRLSARAEQQALGWIAAIDEASLNDNTLDLELVITNEAETPLSGLTVTAVLSRPASGSEDRPFEFTPLGNGVYRASVPAAAGVWDLDGTAVNGRDDEFEFTSRLVLP